MYIAISTPRSVEIEAATASRLKSPDIRQSGTITNYLLEVEENLVM